jgi:hypothetical protein
MNAIYTQLIERLTWLENRHATLGESNLLKDKEVGVVAIGPNWNGAEAVRLEKEVLGFFGFKTPDVLSFNWQFTPDKNDETESGYKKEYKSFLSFFGLDKIAESVKKFRDFLSR